LHTYQSVLKQPRRYAMKNSYLGPEFSDSQIECDLKKANLRYRRLEREPLLDAVAAQIAAGNVVGWFQGRMEWGPRALGNRSIVAHPGLPNMKDVLNARIKHREWFRPFAPSALIWSATLRTETVAAAQAYATAARIRAELRISRVATFPGLRALAWDRTVLYASRGYDLLSAVADENPVRWQTVAKYSPTWWRNLTVRSRLTFRLFRDGFHALAVLSAGHVIEAVPGAI